MTKFLNTKEFSDCESIIESAELVDIDGNPLNLEGVQVEWGLAPGTIDEVTGEISFSGDRVILLTVGSGITFLTPLENGIVDIRSNLPRSPPLLPGLYIQQCRVILPDSSSSLQFQGPIVIVKSLFT